MSTTATKTVTKTGAERRTATRRQPTLGTVCRMEPRSGKDGGAPACGSVGLVWNISTGGVSMLFNDHMERGATVKGVLATSTDGFSLPVTVRVTHVAHLLTGDYLIGCQFDKPIAADDMRHFLPDAPEKI
jgi:hypothetical protein